MDLVRLGRRGLTFGNGSSVSVSGATNSKICIYGIETDDWSYVWGSTFSPRCFSTGNCLGERNVSSLSDGSVQYHMCGGSNTPPTQALTPEPT